MRDMAAMFRTRAEPRREDLLSVMAAVQPSVAGSPGLSPRSSQDLIGLEIELKVKSATIADGFV